MQAFGREVASRTIASVLSTLIVLALGAGWKFIAPALATRLSITFREAFAWVIATVAVIALAIVVWLLRRTLAPALPAKPASLTLALNNGTKPSVTLTNHGGPTKYRVDGRIVSHVDGTQSPQPTQFRCQLQVGGIAGGWDVMLQDGEWANVILGSIESVLPASSAGLTPTQSWTPVGKMLVIRRGTMGQHVRAPDTGAVIELTIKATPPLAEPWPQAVPSRQERRRRNRHTCLIRRCCQVDVVDEMSITCSMWQTSRSVPSHSRVCLCDCQEPTRHMVAEARCPPSWTSADDPESVPAEVTIGDQTCRPRSRHQLGTAARLRCS